MLAQRYREQHGGQHRLDNSGFTHQLHGITDTLWGLFVACGYVFKELHAEARYVIDSVLTAAVSGWRWSAGDRRGR